MGLGCLGREKDGLYWFQVVVELFYLIEHFSIIVDMVYYLTQSSFWLLLAFNNIRGCISRLTVFFVMPILILVPLLLLFWRIFFLIHLFLLFLL